MEINVREYVDAYYSELDAVPAHKRESVEFHRGQALAYLWGRADAGDRIDGLLMDAFSWAYGTMHARLASERHHGARSIQDSWPSFKENLAILDFNGTRLDRVTAKQATA